MRKFLATLLALVMTLALMVPASWGENKDSLSRNPAAH